MGATGSIPSSFSGVWRFRELLPFAPPEQVVTIGEGQTLLQRADKVGRYVGLEPGSLWLQYEGMNPSGSFKDNGMTAAFTHARMVSARRVACASTGNTSAALAVYCSATDLGFRAIIFIGSGKIAYGKLAQALDHGALTIQIVGDFDDAMQRVRQVADRLGIYLMNSVNPFRLEGQKTIMYRILEGLRWEVPDWIVVPGGNLGNSSAFGKAFIELQHLGLIARVPRLAVINAAGARTLDELVGHRDLRWRTDCPRWTRSTTTTASSTPEHDQGVDDRLGDRDQSAGQFEEVPAGAGVLQRRGARGHRPGDHGRQGRVGAGGLGCEPASAASVAGRQAAARGGRDRPVGPRRVHPDRPPAQGPDGHGRLSQHRPGSIRPGARQPRRPPRGLRQSAGRRRQRPRRHHPDDRPLLRNRIAPRSGAVVMNPKGTRIRVVSQSRF